MCEPDDLRRNAGDDGVGPDRGSLREGLAPGTAPTLVCPHRHDGVGVLRTTDSSRSRLPRPARAGLPSAASAIGHHRWATSCSRTVTRSKQWLRRYEASAREAWRRRPGSIRWSSVRCGTKPRSPRLGRRSQRARRQGRPQTVHLGDVATDLEVEHRRARPEGGRRTQFDGYRSDSTVRPSRTCSRTSLSLSARTFKGGHEGHVRGDAIQGPGAEGAAQTVDLVGDGAGDHERHGQPMPVRHGSADPGQCRRKWLEHRRGVRRRS